MSIFIKLKEQIRNYKHDIDKPFHHFITYIIQDRFEEIFPVDGVDMFDKTLNENAEEFSSAEGIEYRKHPLTRFSSFLGLPNRKLSKDAGQSWQNLLDNFRGKQVVANSNRNLVRAAIMIPMNILLTLFKLPLNIIKIVTELIPGILANLIIFTYFVILRKIDNNNDPTGHKVLLAVLASLVLLNVGAFFLLQYFLGCCLTSAYGTMKSASRLANYLSEQLFHSEKIKPFLKGLFVGFVIVTSIMVSLLAFPVAAKMLTATVVPFIAHHLPTIVLNGLDKITQFMQPALTAIGHVATIVAFAFTFPMETLYLIPFAPILVSAPALVGAGLFVSTAIATIGPSVSGYIDDFKAWWNRDPNFAKPLPEEGVRIPTTTSTDPIALCIICTSRYCI